MKTVKLFIKYESKIRKTKLLRPALQNDGCWLGLHSTQGVFYSENNNIRGIIL